VKSLKESGFTVEMDPRVVAGAQAHIASTAENVNSADERSAAVDAVLRSRGLYLFPFQTEGVRWLASRQCGLLADEMGLGKTIQALTAIPSNAPVIVVCPAVAKGVWARETARWRPDLRVSIMSGRGGFRWPYPGEVVVVNYDILRDLVENECAPTGTVLIADEAHAVKSNKTARGKRFGAISSAVQKANGKVWLLTATPLLNRAPELWNILSAANLATEAFGGWKNFVSIMGGRQGAYGIEWGVPDCSRASIALKRVQLRRQRIEVLPDLPVKTWREIDIDIDDATKKACDDALSAIGLDPLTLEQVDLLESGIRFETLAAARAALAKCKIPSMLETIEDFEEQSEPLVVFSAHRAPIDILKNRDGWAVITGDTSPDERTRLETSFQAGELKGVGCTIKAGGVAITLTKSANALFVDQEWTPALNAQAEDRVCRIGQSRGVVITSMVGNHPLDRRVYALLAKKREVIENTVEAARIVPTAPVEVIMPSLDLSSVVVAEQATGAGRPIATTETARKASPVVNRSPRRGPKSGREEWAMRALLILSDNDPDQATEQNGVGFNKFDGDIGHSLAGQVKGGLTDKQWDLAVKVCAKYRGQVGSMPA
jgi:SWI/SNF-related matrix-associated actin-dependent regulator 1 of chromatin subfamily A